MPDVIVGLSGGVDSAVAALLLRQQGYRVRGLFMKNWDEDDEAGHCPAARDLADARAVARQLGIELLTASFSAQYWNRVFSHFLDEYACGRTPSPDIVCNREIKFRAFLDHARELGAGRIATGHYARIEYEPAVRLLRGADPDKDQTYFLHTLDQAQLAHSLFPLGSLYKREVREIARRAGLPNADRKDSTGICFIGERRFSEFLSRYLQKQPGEIRTLDGTVIGQHQGLMFHTIGQRQGLGIGGSRDSSGEPWYVARKDTATNVLYVVQGKDHPALYASGVRAGRLHWIAGRPPVAPYRCMARIRHRQPLQDCVLQPRTGGNCSVLFDTPQRAIAPGQSVVLYSGEECLGGAIMEQAMVGA